MQERSGGRERPPRAWHLFRAGSRRHRRLGVLAVWAAVERFSGVKLGIREVRPGGLLRLSVARRRGQMVLLRDGTCICPGDVFLELHLDNHRLGRLAGEGASVWTLLAVLRQDLRALAAQMEAGTFGQAVALHGATLLADAGPRLGFERSPLPRTAGAHLHRFFFAGLVALHNPRGWRAVSQKSRRWPADLWMSRAELLSRYGRGGAVTAIPAAAFGKP